MGHFVIGADSVGDICGVWIRCVAEHSFPRKFPIHPTSAVRSTFIIVRLTIRFKCSDVSVFGQYHLSTVTRNRTRTIFLVPFARILCGLNNLFFVPTNCSRRRFVTTRTRDPSFFNRVSRSLNNLTSRLIPNFVTLHVISPLRTIRIPGSRNYLSSDKRKTSVFRRTPTITSVHRLIHPTRHFRNTRNVTITRRSDRRRNRDQRGRTNYLRHHVVKVSSNYGTRKFVRWRRITQGRPLRVEGNCRGVQVFLTRYQGVISRKSAVRVRDHVRQPRYLREGELRPLPSNFRP